jgi:hypothetical protein
VALGQCRWTCRAYSARRRVSCRRWVHHDGLALNGDVTGPGVPWYRRYARKLVLRKDTEVFFYSCIAISAAVDGMLTYPSLLESDVVGYIGHFTLMVFGLEVSMKFVSETGSYDSTRGYFDDTWNAFDMLMLSTILVLAPIAEAQEGQAAARCMRVLRLIRACRIFRAAKVTPKLSLVMETLIKSMASVSYIFGFMVLLSYLFAIVAVTLFVRIARLRTWPAASAACDRMAENCAGGRGRMTRSTLAI